MEQVKKFEKKIKEKTGDNKWQLDSHPCELIFKYLELIALEREKEDEARMFSERRSKVMQEKGIIVEAICKYANVEILNAKDYIKERDEKSSELCQYLVDNFGELKGVKVPDDGEERYNWLESVITFMYR